MSVDIRHGRVIFRTENLKLEKITIRNNIFIQNYGRSIVE